MNKRIIYLTVTCLLLLTSINVNAQSHDVEAKYDKTYNVELKEEIINNNTIEIVLDNYTLEFASSLSNIKVVIIKTTNDANNYAKNFTGKDENYYIVFYNENNKLTSGEISIQLKSNNKVLNVYDKDGKVVEKSSDKITLNSNDYYISVSDKEIIDKSDYVITDIDSLVHDLEEIEINSNDTIEIYNYTNIKVNNNQKLGTGYKVIVTGQDSITTYNIVVMGDITGDANINLNDVTRLYHNYKGIEDMHEAFILAGDVNNDNIINLNDVTKIYHYYKKIIPSL